MPKNNLLPLLADKQGQIFKLENYTAAACCGPSNSETPQNTMSYCLQPDLYLRYFQPENYTFSHVMKNIYMALSLDKHAALNYLNCLNKGENNNGIWKF